MHVLILAGGEGSRLWPFSRPDCPKQFLSFGDTTTLLQKTILRFSGLSFVQSISIVTNKAYAFLVEKELERIDLKETVNLIIEPKRKNTAPAIAYSLKWLEENKKLDLEEKILILPSDHLIEPQALFASYLEAIDFSFSKEALLLFGIRPTRAETGYGYIQMGPRKDVLTYQVEAFIEKPSLEKATEYLRSGDYYWNSGIFAATLGWFWRSFRENAPEIFHLLEKGVEEMEQRFDAISKISFDYAILEKSKEVVVCPLAISWSDIGSWDGLYEVMHKDRDQNVFLGEVQAVDTKRSLILTSKKKVSTIGVEDLLIVETEDAILITKRGASQRVKELLEPPVGCQ